MAAFMDKALFDPDQGYYSKNIAKIGFRGDFSTSATQSRLLARALVAGWRECCKQQGRLLPFLEIGGGSGDLMLDISKELSWWERLRVRYLMVERSAHLRDFQKMAGGGFVRCYEDIAPALRACKGCAFIFSNELVDAFPARQFVFQEGEWWELGLAVIDRQIIRQAYQQDLPESLAFERWAQDGQVIEVHESYLQWYASWQEHWKCGTLITIDYGDENNLLYYRRPQGSLRGYKSHQVLQADELPALCGHCDITCDVNFSDLKCLAERSLHDVVELIDQHDFLAPYAKAGDAADAHLIAKPGAGDHFKVLISQRFSV